MTKIRKWNYGNYSSGNYGAHTIAIDIGNITLYFSYNTIVAFRSYEHGLVISENNWGRTTGKHLNWINDNKKLRISHEEFEQKLTELLKEHNLIVR